jgi:hypothetical protein
MRFRIILSSREVFIVNSFLFGIYIANASTIITTISIITVEANLSIGIKGNRNQTSGIVNKLTIITEMSNLHDLLYILTNSPVNITSAKYENIIRAIGVSTCGIGFNTICFSIIFPQFIFSPNGWRVSRLADCADIGSLYFHFHRRTYQRRHQAEGQVGLTRWLGELF